MTKYAGNKFIIKSSPVGYDDEVLTSTDVTALRVTITDPDGVTVVDNVAMTYNTGKARWDYAWNTDGYAPGVYDVQVDIVDLEGDVADSTPSKVTLSRLA